MDEADKYKQRLEAIAEKLRLQEEEERARREMEEERLRLQQLKRKSLRDQWLMEGAPLSPVSSDTQSPRSPVWGSETQEMEEHIDQYSCRLQPESQRWIDEEEKKPMENRLVQEAARTAVAGTESAGDGVCFHEGLPLDENQSLLTNGGGEVDTSPVSSNSSQSSISGPGAALASSDHPWLSVSEVEPTPCPSVGVEEEEAVVMRAECVIVTDEEEEGEEVIEGHFEGMHPDQERQEAVEEKVQREAAEEKHEATQPTAGESPLPAGEEEVLPLGGAVMSAVPVCSRSDSTSERESDVAAAATQEGADLSSQYQEPPTLPSQFEDVFLVDPQGDKRMEGMPQEQDSLLFQAKAPESHTEAAAAADTSASTEIRSPNRSSHEKKSKTSKHSSGLCCTVM